MKAKKILTISLSGIGNTILFTPFLNCLRKNYPEAEIDFLTLNQTMADVVSGSSLVDNIFVLSKRQFRIFKILWQLRRKQYDYSIAAFPSNKWQFNVLAFLIGATNRVTHRYNYGKLKTLSFLQNKKILAIEGIHDVEQNMNLLKIFGVNVKNEERKLIFYISDENKKFAKEFLVENQLENKFLVGIHPGAGGFYKGWQGFAKRWSEENFAKLCDTLIEEKDAKVLIFGGPEEIGLKNKVRSLAKHKEDIIIIDESLKHTAAIIGKCNLFISNDSGLMHVAATFNVPTIGIFGPTNYKRTAPYGKNCHFIRRDLSCGSCLIYPFHSTSSKIRCKRNFECLRGITIKDVINKINEDEK